MTMIKWWGPIAKGDIAWCWFPNLPGLSRPPKPRPAAILRAEQRPDGNYEVVAVYGTSQKLTVRYPYDVVVDAFVWQGTGLARTTRFDFTQRVVMPFSDEWFTPPYWNPASPIIGHLPLGDPAFRARINDAVRTSNAVLFPPAAAQPGNP